MSKHFSNVAQLGSFGEFVYRDLCLKNNLVIQRTNFCHTDFVIYLDKYTIYIDVKTSESKIHAYKGKRFHEKIIYESIAIDGEFVKFFPDINSPLSEHAGTSLGTLTEFKTRWLTLQEGHTKKSSRLADIERTSLEDALRILYSSFRFVERGDASKSRWTGTVDNLPGSSKIIDSYEVTVFLQFGCENFEEKLQRITLIPHILLRQGKAPMCKSDKRQAKKGLEEVLDLGAYHQKFPYLSFVTVKEFIFGFENLVKEKKVYL